MQLLSIFQQMYLHVHVHVWHMYVLGVGVGVDVGVGGGNPAVSDLVIVGIDIVRRMQFSGLWC